MFPFTLATLPTVMITVEYMRRRAGKERARPSAGADQQEATSSISTRAPLGRRLTSTQARAGQGPSKKAA